MFQIWHACCTAGISHPDAGDGLFLQGSAPVGALVALYPGLVYEPMHYRSVLWPPKHKQSYCLLLEGLNV